MGRPRGIVPLCLWPGLAQIYTGQWRRGIVLCGSATALLNLALIAGWIWTELLSREWLIVVWAGVATMWVGASAATIRGIRSRNVGSEPESDSDSVAEHRQALERYLGRQWADAERGWERVLRRDPEDCDALLHLATLYRRQGRVHEASQALRACRRGDVPGKWSWEIAREAQRVASNGSEA